MRSWIKLCEGLTESPQDDADMAGKADKLSLEISHLIYGGIKQQYHFEFTGIGEFYGWSFESLGITKNYPELSDMILLLGLKKSNTVGLSGSVLKFDTNFLDKFGRAIFVHGLKEFSSEAVHILTGSTSFVEVLEHEFMHVFDATRAPAIMNRKIDSTDKASYFNDPAEFNAYYHDAVKMLTSILNAGSLSDMRDMAEIYNFTGNFATDLKSIIGKNLFTRTFVQWLTLPRRKAFLRRIYKLHQDVIDSIQHK